MSGVRAWNLITFNFVAVVFAMSAIVGCSMEFKTKPVALPSKSSVVQVEMNNDDAQATEPDQTPTGQPTAVGPQPQPQPQPQSYVMNLIDLSAGGRQRKSSEQLKKSILACVGAQSEGDSGIIDEENPSILQVTNDMLVNASSTSKPKGRFGFLIVGNAADVVGKSILDLEKSFIDVEGTTSGVNAASLDEELYLNSLQTIASVVAFNCDVEDESSKCFCSTREKAREMVQRCLSLFDPSSVEFSEAFGGFAEACSANDSDAGLFKRRKAIVSLLSSYAFATSR